MINKLKKLIAVDWLNVAMILVSVTYCAYSAYIGEHGFTMLFGVFACMGVKHAKSELDKQG